jgi:hypothetical protein
MTTDINKFDCILRWKEFLSDAEDYFPERGSAYYITALAERTVTLHFNVINK